MQANHRHESGHLAVSNSQKGSIGADFFGKWVQYFEEIGVITALTTMTLLYSLSILSRYVTKTSMPWTEELVRFCFIWATFLGTSIGVKRGAHLGVAALQNALPQKGQKYVFAAIALCCIFTCVVLAWHGGRMVHLQYTMGQKSSQIGLPIFLVGLAIPVGLGLSIIRFLQVLIAKLKG